MNKILITTLALIVIAGGYFFLGASDEKTGSINSDTIDSTYGFSFTPPEGWKLWESKTVSYDFDYNKLFNNLEIEIEEFFNDNWQLENSRGFVFTTLDRNLSFDGEESLGEVVFDSPVEMLDVLSLTIENQSNYNNLKKSKLEFETISFMGVESEVVVASDIDGIKAVFLIIPLENGMHLNVTKYLQSDVDTMEWFRTNLKGLSVE